MNMPNGFWEPLNPGWFLQWAVEDEVRKNPNRNVTVYAGSRAICGYVVSNPSGEKIVLHAKDGLFKE
jgi:hypothetical protein